MMSWNQIKYAGIGFGSLLLLLLAWGVLVEPRLFEVKEENAAIPGLPNEWSGQRIALIADLQIGMWFGNEETDRRIVDRIIQEKPAFVLIAGDFIYKPTDEDERDDLEREDTHAFRQEVEGAVALVRPLVRAGLPVYAVLGNHDYGMNHPDSIKNVAEAVRAGLEGAGIRVLENAALPLSLPDYKATKENSNSATKLYLAGIGSRYAGHDRSAAAVAQIPDGAPRIVSCIIPIPSPPYRPERRHARSPAIPTADRFASPLPKRGRGWRCRRISKCTSTAGSIASANPAIVSTSIAGSGSAPSQCGSTAGRS